MSLIARRGLAIPRPSYSVWRPLCDVPMQREATLRRRDIDAVMSSKLPLVAIVGQCRASCFNPDFSNARFAFHRSFTPGKHSVTLAPRWLFGFPSPSFFCCILNSTSRQLKPIAHYTLPSSSASSSQYPLRVPFIRSWCGHQANERVLLRWMTAMMIPLQTWG